ncbi:gag protease polyprotein [Cucumis melo var. makuwa]|uniref:Gag protease polyprotein n=1 Tax=Cucumis melo var. makuwa TaxID=1194695 RepID=A0A5D3BKG9_CUCMM|nr:gag protease polyprotein [Cucumis melo var. makuwa]TYJ99793.1 gag protease polyprotein [Cucumis melo var. makuwa]
MSIKDYVDGTPFIHFSSRHRLHLHLWGCRPSSSLSLPRRPSAAPHRREDIQQQLPPTVLLLVSMSTTIHRPSLLRLCSVDCRTSCVDIGIREGTLKSSGSAAGLFRDSPFTRVDPLGVDSTKRHSQGPGKVFLTTGPRIEAGNVVVDMGLYVRVQRGTDRREARRMREGHMDTSGFLYALSDLFCYSLFSLSDRGMLSHETKGIIVREMPPRRGVRRGGRGGRGRRAGRVQPEVHPVVQATDLAAPVTHADLAAMEQRFRDLIMQMREQQQHAPPAPAPAPVVTQVVPDQLSAEAKHLRDFRKYNPMTFIGSLEDPTRAQMWLSSLETIFRYMKCPEDQKVQCAIFMLTYRGTAGWKTTERMLGGDVGQIT